MTQANQNNTPSTNGHSIPCLYEYTLARLGLQDTPDMRVLFWDAYDVLEWDITKDLHVVPELSEDAPCSICDKPWIAIPTHQILHLIKGTEFSQVPATETMIEHYQCLIKFSHNGQSDLSELRINGIDVGTAHDSALRTLKEVAYKNGWMA